MTRGDRMVDPSAWGGPIRIAALDDPRSGETPCRDLINLGPVVSADLAEEDIHTLGDLRRRGALDAFESVMVTKLHRGVRKNLFHAMYLYALFGAVQDVNCKHLGECVRRGLRGRAEAIKKELTG